MAELKITTDWWFFNSTQSDAEPGITRFPTKSYRKHLQNLPKGDYEK